LLVPLDKHHCGSAVDAVRAMAVLLKMNKYLGFGLSVLIALFGAIFVMIQSMSFSLADGKELRERVKAQKEMLAKVEKRQEKMDDRQRKIFEMMKGVEGIIKRWNSNGSKSSD
jgi:hypothetical protein